MISVIVPIYNSEKYLDQCLASIVNQKYYDLEIILVNVVLLILVEKYVKNIRKKIKELFL